MVKEFSIIRRWRRFAAGKAGCASAAPACAVGRPSRPCGGRYRGVQRRHAPRRHRGIPPALRFR
ncbi:hypothetical protein WT70_14580 [Burkholderia stagnalis]|nr:hypothetical protein WT28_26355 [Burkholderia stagnalis]KWI14156.1 hypothetical protein WT70_14580 [Burkholderia stagnalis]